MFAREWSWVVSNGGSTLPLNFTAKSMLSLEPASTLIVVLSGHQCETTSSSPTLFSTLLTSWRGQNSQWLGGFALSDPSSTARATPRWDRLHRRLVQIRIE